MKATYHLRERKLIINLQPKELAQLSVQKKLTTQLISQHYEFHEKTIDLRYNEEKHSPHISITTTKDGYALEISPRNYVDLLVKKQTVTGQCSERHLNFNLEMKISH